MIIKAKYSGYCPKCRQKINIGDEVIWNRGVPAYHKECQTKEITPPTNQYKISPLFPSPPYEESMISFWNMGKKPTKLDTIRLPSNSPRWKEWRKILKFPDDISDKDVIYKLQKMAENFGSIVVDRLPEGVGGGLKVRGG